MISIILPFHNDSHYLPHALGSCLLQDVPVQVIVINDCSDVPPTSDVMNLINAISDKYIYNETNLGLAGARNVGIRNSNYQFIYPLDADDWLYPHVLGDMVKNMGDNDVVFGNITAKHDGDIHIPAGWNGVTKDKLLKDNPVWCGSLYRKYSLEEVGLYDEYPFANYEDFRLHCKLFKAGARFKYIDRVIYRHTEREGSMLSDLHKRTDYWKKFASSIL